jgi:hypothetical protein
MIKMILEGWEEFIEKKIQTLSPPSRGQALALSLTKAREQDKKKQEKIKK